MFEYDRQIVFPFTVSRRSVIIGGPPCPNATRATAATNIAIINRRTF
jgi:hypothetical protein